MAGLVRLALRNWRFELVSTETTRYHPFQVQAGSEQMSGFRMVLFGAIASLVLLAGSGYVGLRLAALLPERLRWLVWSLVAGFLVLFPATFLLMRVSARADWHRPMYVAGFLAMGLFSLLVAGFLALDLAREAVRLADWLARAAGREAPSRLLFPSDPERRRFLVNSLRVAVAASGTAITGWGFRTARQSPEVVRLTLPIAHLPPALEGFRIALLTDLHVCADITREYVQRVVRAVNREQPDLVAFTGDLADGQVSVLQDDVAPLASLHSRHGTCFVTGNHEYYSDLDGWLAEVRALGMDVLLNEHRVLQHDGAPLVVAGVTDHHTGLMVPEHASDPGKALVGAPEGVLRLFLAHQPASARKAAELGADVVLCGHTHGGQFFPWTGAVQLVQPYACGLHREGKTLIYTSRGTGYWGPPLRTGGAGEITLVTLKTA